jgi:hypothetical protein
MMKKFYAAFLVTLIGSIFAFSQTETKPTAGWKTFAPEKEEFSVEIPIALDASVFKNDELNSRYLNKFGGTYYFIFSDDKKKSWQLAQVEDFLTAQGQTAKPEKIGDFEIGRFAFSDRLNFYHTVVVAESKNRYYAFQTVSPTKENAAVERFFKSLKLKTTDGKTIELREEKAINITIQTEEPEIKKAAPVSGIGLGNGSGSGYGIGTGRGNQTTPGTTPTLSPTKTTTGVKILTKPRANFTDLARFYEITGKVVLRVTFSTNGTVGAVTPLAKLPFGLTERAIAAARGITFEPAMREGTPYSVTKPVEYTFTLF